MNKEQIIIIALIVVIIYLAYQQNNQPNLLGNSAEKISELKQQVQHYQTLYENRVKKDLGYSQSSQTTQTEDLAILTQQDQIILAKVKEFRLLIEKVEDHSIDRSQMNEIEALAEQITQPAVKIIANQVITDSAFILGHNNLLTKLADQEDKTGQLREQQQEQLRKINLLFDEQAKDYQFIDFNGLYALLSSIAEREREREQK
jgi:hypothetical protein